MKRALIALVAVGFVVAAISIARAHSGEQETPAADKSREFDREPTTEQIKQQTDQMLRAQAELAERVAEESNSGSHTLRITIREERPGDVWVPATIAGKPACVTPPKEVPTSVNVKAGVGGSYVVTKLAPLEARLLKDGACEATLELLVHPLHRYTISLTGTGHGKFDPVRVRHSGQPQQVTVVG